jgi:hypothetical protein
MRWTLQRYRFLEPVSVTCRTRNSFPCPGEGYVFVANLCRAGGTGAYAARRGRVPRFYFHVHDEYQAEDEEGRDLPDAEAARAEAIHGARSLAADEVLHGHLHLHHKIIVEDENGGRVHTLPFRDAVEIYDQDEKIVDSSA